MYYEKVLHEGTEHETTMRRKATKPLLVKKLLASGWKAAKSEAKPIDKMNVAELDARAAANGIDVSSAANKAEKAAIIMAAMEEKEG